MLSIDNDDIMAFTFTLFTKDIRMILSQNGLIFTNI